MDQSHKLTPGRTSPRFNNENEMPIGIGRRRYHNLLAVIRERVALSAGQTTEMVDCRRRPTALGRWRRDGRGRETRVVQKQPPRTLRSTTAGCIVKREGQLQRIAATRVTGRIHGAATKAKEGRGPLQREEGSPINNHGWIR